MHSDNEKQVSWFHAIHSTFSYYQALLKKDSKWLIPLQYDASTLHFVNLFLKDHELVSFNVNGTLEKIASCLPEDVPLSTLIADFSTYYVANNLALTQPELKLVAKQLANKKRTLESRKQTARLGPEFFLGDFKLENEKDGPNVFLFRDNVRKKIARNYSDFKQQDLETKKKISMSNWSEENFAKSVRSLYIFYSTHTSEFYTKRQLFKVIQIQQFTSGLARKSASNIVSKFNTFLIKNKFITQDYDDIKSITVNKDIPFPADNNELINLFKKFKELYYRRECSSTVSGTDVQRPLAKPAAAVSINKAAISFVLDDQDQQNSFVPH
jgi:hypothetical protein